MIAVIAFKFCMSQTLDSADDICLLAQKWSDTRAKLEKLDMEALKINQFKTKEMESTLVQIWH
jgi:hypothetical protein